MPYKEPTDIPRLPLVWEAWPLAERITAAGEYLKANPVILPWAGLAAVAVTMLEQPGKIVCNNVAGIMSQGETEPWGWRASVWQHHRPVGYCLAKEGLDPDGGGKPFLAFASTVDSLGFLIDRCWARGIYDGPSYAGSWFGAEPHSPAWDRAARDFHEVHARVKKEWDNADTA